MLIKVNGVEGSLSRFARGKYSFCGAIAEQKGRFYPKQPVGPMMTQGALPKADMKKIIDENLKVD